VSKVESAYYRKDTHSQMMWARSMRNGPRLRVSLVSDSRTIGQGAYGTSLDYTIFLFSDSEVIGKGADGTSLDYTVFLFSDSQMIGQEAYVTSLGHTAYLVSNKARRRQLEGKGHPRRTGSLSICALHCHCMKPVSSLFHLSCTIKLSRTSIESLSGR
jgi:hypothetical protein